MFQAHAHVRTDKAGRYLAQLCKHFAHKVTVEWTETEGHADFGVGICRMRATGGHLLLACSADTQDGLERVKYIVQDHVTRFGWREKLAVTWSAGPSADMT